MKETIEAAEFELEAQAREMVWLWVRRPAQTLRAITMNTLLTRLQRYRPVLISLIATAVLFTLVHLVIKARDSSGVGLADIRAGNELVVLTRNAPTTYYEDKDEQPTGLEYDLIQAYGQRLGVPVRYVIKETVIEQGKNPNYWHDLKQILPLLAQKPFFRKLKHGYARGSEPVSYVQRPREYQDVLEHELSR